MMNRIHRGNQKLQLYALTVILFLDKNGGGLLERI